MKESPRTKDVEKGVPRDVRKSGNPLCAIYAKKKDCANHQSIVIPGKIVFQNETTRVTVRHHGTRHDAFLICKTIMKSNKRVVDYYLYRGL